jgi:hypothetical protein
MHACANEVMHIYANKLIKKESIILALNYLIWELRLGQI